MVWGRVICLLPLFFALAQSGQVFVHMSDLHLDPLYNSPDGKGDLMCRSAHHSEFGTLGCDSPFTLTESSFRDAASVTAGSDTAFVLVSGDLAAHYLPTPELVLDAVANVTDLTRTWFPDIPKIMVAGNNDFYPHYHTKCGDTWYGHLADLWKGIIPDNSLQDFLKHGCYTVRVQPKLKIVVLNTVFFSQSLEPSIGGDSDPCGVLEWLKRELRLAQADGDSVYVVGHIPPGVGRGGGDDVMWHSQYVCSYQTVMRDFANVVKVQLYGHDHRDEWRLPNVGPGSSEECGNSSSPFDPPPLLMAPAVSPIRYNNPAYRVVTIGDNAQPADWVSRYTDIASRGTWRDLFTFSEFAGTEELSFKGVLAATKALMEDPALGEKFNLLRSAYQETSLKPWKCVACQFQYLDTSSIRACERHAGCSGGKHNGFTHIDVGS